MKIHTTLLLAALLAAGPAAAQVNFGSYVSIGDSLTAGFSSGTLAERHQVVSYPALIARQGGVTDFQQPLVGDPGLPQGELQLLNLAPVTVIAPRPGRGVPKNLTFPRPYNNIAVPGATLTNALVRVSDNGGFHDLVLRGLGTQVQQALALRPTLITVWLGNNDVLGAATSGRALPGVTLTPPEIFRAVFQQVISALRPSGAKIFAANLPDVTSIPFVTTIRPFITVAGLQIPLIGPNGPLSADSYVLLPASGQLAQGIGLPPPIGTGIPLADQYILDPAEVRLIRSYVDANNQAIAEISAAAGVPVLDVNRFLKEFATTGRVIGGVRLSASFLTGGLFSYDGVHASDLGYAIVANEWIRLFNENGADVPPVDLGAYLGATSRSAVIDPPRGFIFSDEAAAQLRMIFPALDDAEK